MIEPNLRTPPADTSAQVTDSYIKAVNLNRRIITAAQLAQQSLYDMCMGFKEMRDSKLYKELGYADFADYCENETGIKRRQVYSYIQVAEKLPDEFVQSTAQIGVQKLYLLSSLSEQERTEITQTTDLESTSVRQLEEKIKTLKSDNDKLIEKAYNECRRADAMSDKNQELAGRICHLESEIKELESRPVDVAVAEPSAEDIAKIKSEAEAAAKAEYEAKLAAEKKKVQSIAQTASKGDDTAVIKHYFSEIQRQMNEAVVLIGKNENREKLKAAFSRLLDECEKIISKI